MSVSFRRPKRSDRVIDFITFVKMQETLEQVANCAYTANFSVFRAPNWMSIGLHTSSAMDYSDFAFGHSISGTTVTITAGEIHQGTRDPIEVVETALPITIDHQYAFVEHVFNSGIAIIPNTPERATAVRPTSDSATLRVWLCRFRLVDGVVSLEKPIGYVGNIYITGTVA